MDRIMGSEVLTGMIHIHTPPMGGTKGTAMPVVVHSGLELQDALLGLFLGDRGGLGSGSSGRVQAVDGGGLQRGKQGLDF